MSLREEPVRFATLLGFGIFSLICATPAVRAESPETKIFNDLFADKIAAARTSDEKIALAKQMLAAAAQTTGQNKIFLLLCNGAYDLTATYREGYPTAAEALGQIIEHVPEQKTDALKRLIAVRMRQYNGAIRSDKVEAGEAYLEALMLSAESAENPAEALPLYKRARSVARVIRSDRAPEVQAAHDLALAEMQLARTVDLLKRQLKVNSKNEAAARKLLEILIGEANQPAEARKYSFLAPEPLKPVVAAATESTGKLQPAQHLELGKWLHLRTKEAPEEFRHSLLSRAKQHLEAFLEKGPDTGANRAIRNRKKR